MKYIRDLEVAGKRVLVRVDINVPLGEDGTVDKYEDWRIRTILPTIRYLSERAATILLLGHLGRPGGKKDKALSLLPVSEYLSKLLGKKVVFLESWEEGEKGMAAGDVNIRRLPEYIGANPDWKDRVILPPLVLFENLRFQPGEEANDPEFARLLASFGDIYINDAFANSHRAHASIVGVPGLLPAAAGLLLEREIKVLGEVRRNPLRPLVVIIGGAKPETKLPLFKEYLAIADHVLVGGVLANVLLALKGIAVGRSAWYGEGFEELKDTLMQCCDLTDTRLHLPVDAVISRAKDGSQKTAIAAVGNIERSRIGHGDHFILDIGPDTVDLFKRIIGSARTIVWNGPMGFYEAEVFRAGTNAVARAVVESSAYSVVGGGDSVASLQRLELREGVDHVSTGGGAMLELLAGKELPGIVALG